MSNHSIEVSFMDDAYMFNYMVPQCPEGYIRHIRNTHIDWEDAKMIKKLILKSSHTYTLIGSVGRVIPGIT